MTIIIEDVQPGADLVVKVSRAGSVHVSAADFRDAIGLPMPSRGAVRTVFQDESDRAGFRAVTACLGGIRDIIEGADHTIEALERAFRNSEPR